MFSMFFRWLSNGTYAAVMAGFNRAVTELSDGDDSPQLAELRAKLTAAAATVTATPALPEATEGETVKPRRAK